MPKNSSLATTTPTDVSAPAPRRIDPLFNAVFIRVFGKKESKPILRTLVNLIFNKVGLSPIDEITSINAEHTLYEGHVECKTPRIDIRLEAAGRLVDLEVQNYPEDINSRSSLYASQLMVSSVGVGENYKDVPQVVVITLLSDMVMFPSTDEVVSVCRMQWQDSSGANLQAGNDRILFVTA